MRKINHKSTKHLSENFVDEQDDGLTESDHYEYEKEEIEENDYVVPIRPGEQKCVMKPINLGQLLDDKANINLNPPYQRGDVWKPKQKKELIKSIFMGTSINTLHFVNHKESPERDSMDGKQRYSTTLEFQEDKLVVPVTLSDGDYEITWSDLRRAKDNNNLAMLRQSFLEHTVMTCQYPPMSYEAARDEFMRLNYGVNLSAEEKIYGNYFLSKKLFQYLFQNSCPPLFGNFRSELAEDYRYSGTRFCTNVCLLCFGSSFNDIYAHRQYGAKVVAKFANKINDRLSDIGFYANHPMNDDVLKSLNIYKNYKLLKKGIHLVGLFLNYKVKRPHIDRNTVFDLVVLTINKLQANIITSSYVEQNLEKFYKLSVSWQNIKTTESGLKKHTNTSKGVDIRFIKLDHLFNNCGFDLGRKNKNASKAQKNLANISTGSLCPITGADLTPKNIVTDHKKSKATSSTTDFENISDVGNRLKTDLTQETVKKISDYLSD